MSSPKIGIIYVGKTAEFVCATKIKSNSIKSLNQQGATLCLHQTARGNEIWQYFSVHHKQC